MTTPILARRRVMPREQADLLVKQIVPSGIETELIHDAAVITDPDLGEPVIAYLPMAVEDVNRLTAAVLAITDWNSQARAGTIRASAATFGMAPRRPTYKRDACHITLMAREHPDIHAVLAGFAVPLGAMLETVSPDVADRDRMVIAEIQDEWRMAPGAAWTSGVVNKTTQLPYHRDSMNFDAWVGMPVIRSGVSGGYLHIPEYGLALTCRNGYVVAFNGYRLVHGVTPITAIRPARNGQPGGYRYSIVYYALRGMKDCATFAAELAGGQARRTAREQHQMEFVTGRITDWR